MRYLRRLLIIVAPFVLTCSFLFLSCSSHTVSTWEDWCSQLLGEDLHKKYNAFAIRFDDEAIRADFVRNYNDFVVEKIAHTYLDGAALYDDVVQELVRLKMIGVWNEGDNLYMKNALLITDDELGINEFKEWEMQFRKYLAIEQNREIMDDFQYCIYGTINTHFNNFILISADDDSVVISLEFTRQEGFK